MSSCASSSSSAIGSVELREGESLPITVRLAAVPTSATLQITAATVTLERAGTGADIFTDEDATGFDAAEASTVSVWHQLDTREPAAGLDALSVGDYRLIFTVTSEGSDGLTRIERPVIDVRIVRAA